MKIRVYYEDTDTGTIVYHSNYLNFCERARSEAFFAKGLSPELNGGGFVAKSIEANYIKPAKLGDMLEVKSSLDQMRAASFVLLQSIYKENKKIFDMKITLAHIDSNGSVKKMDKDTKKLISSLFDN